MNIGNHIEDKYLPDGSAWYVVQTLPDLEPRIADFILKKENQQKHGVLGEVFEVFIPYETILQPKDGKMIESQKSFYPGYVFVRMILSPETMDFVRNTPQSAGLINPNHPTPVSLREMNRIKNIMQKSEAAPSVQTAFEQGDNVRICDGPFTGFQGMIEKVDHILQRVTIAVKIFDRETLVALDFAQVELISGA